VTAKYVKKAKKCLKMQTKKCQKCTPKTPKCTQFFCIIKHKKMSNNHTKKFNFQKNSKNSITQKNSKKFKKKIAKNAKTSFLSKILV
jgi:hypothetical protein